MLFVNTLLTLILADDVSCKTISARVNAAGPGAMLARTEPAVTAYRSHLLMRTTRSAPFGSAMKQPDSSTVASAFAETPEARASKAASPVSARTPKMDALVKRVASSPRFSFEAAAAAVNDAMGTVKINTLHRLA
jgi:hypothetical protein